MFGGKRLFQIILSKLPCTHHVKRELKLTNADKNRGDREGYETVEEMQCHCHFVCSWSGTMPLTFYYETSSRKWNRPKPQSSKRPSSKRTILLFLTWQRWKFRMSALWSSLTETPKSERNCQGDVVTRVHPVQKKASHLLCTLPGFSKAQPAGGCLILGITLITFLCVIHKPG